MNDSVDIKRHVYLRTIAKLKGHAEFFFGDSVTEQQHINTRFGCIGIPPRRPYIWWCSLGSYRLGGGEFNPDITHNFPDTDGRRTYNICLASANQICTFFKVTQL